MLVLLGTGGLALGGAEGGVPLEELRGIVLHRDATNQETRVADLLRDQLWRRYRLARTVTDRPLSDRAIYVGRQAALDSGLVVQKELEVLKPDSYILRTRGPRVAVAGNTPQGTIYGVYALLRKLGVRFYPWHHGGGLEVFNPIRGRVVPEMDETNTPFFEHRDLLSQYDRGRYGGTIREFALGDLLFLRNPKDPEYAMFKDGGFVNWDHTAGYLVPKAKYGVHPEYYADNVRGTSLTTRATHDLAVCMCEPEVRRIASERTVAWIHRQSERRFFSVMDGDGARPYCSQCSSSDPLPDYYTDRLLGWVNQVSRAVRMRYPEKTLFTMAYNQGVKVPVATAPEKNVLVAYVPWFWTSRASSAVGFSHPLNMVAAEELDEWLSRFPGQVGTYDFAGRWVFGTAERIKYLARNGVRWIYIDPDDDDLLHWVASQLLWDPCRETEDLIDEFTTAFYGPAADIMQKYLRSQRDTVARRALESRDVFADAAFGVQVWKWMNDAEVLADGADLELQTRILEGVADGLFAVLNGARAGSLDATFAKTVYERYLAVHARILRNLKRLHVGQGGTMSYTQELWESLGVLGIPLARENKGDASALLREAADSFDGAFRDVTAEATPAGRVGLSAMLDFNGPSEPDHWRLRSFGTSASGKVRIAAVPMPVGGSKAGISIFAPLTRLMAGVRGRQPVHFGRVHGTRNLDNGIEMGRRDSVYWHVHATHDTPVTFYLTLGDRRYRSDISLHSGEQIVRIKMESFPGKDGRNPRFPLPLRAIGMDIWPQDNFYPYPPARDTRITLFTLYAGTGEPRTAYMPHADKTIWLTAFRPNLSHGDGAIERVARAYVDRGGDQQTILGDYGGAIGERYRSFTEYRISSPIYGILADRENPAARKIRAGLREIGGVDLPLIPSRIAANDAQGGNLVYVGRQAALLSNEITQKELEKLKPRGVWTRARHGRVVIAGTDRDADLAGVEQFLQDEQPATTGEGAQLRFIHEWYRRDEPVFNTGGPDCRNQSDDN